MRLDFFVGLKKCRAEFKPDRALFGKNVGVGPHINFLTLMYKNIRYR